MKIVKRDFTLLELLAVIAIISILAFAIGGAVGGATEKAKEKKAMATLSAIEGSISQYVTTYGYPPKELKDLLKENNPRQVEFFKGDLIPLDPFSTTNDIVQVVKEVKSVTYDKTRKRIESIKLDGNGFVIYSVGPNGVADGAGSASGGINDGETDGKDDISVYVSF